MSSAGVVKHLTGTERFWFSIDFAGADVPWPWTDEDARHCGHLDLLRERIDGATGM